MKAMIFAAGLGTRLKPLTDHMPKALVPVAGTPMLEHVLLKLKASGFTHIIINVHHFSSQIIQFLASRQNFGLHIQISDESQQLLDTGGGIRKASLQFGSSEPILVHNVDILSNVDLRALYQSHLTSRQDATLLVSRRQTSRYLLFDPHMRLSGWTNLTTGEVRPTGHIYRPDEETPYAFSGIHVLSPSIFSAMQSWPDKFPIMDFYLSHCDQLQIRGQLAPHLQLIDIGKPETLKQAEEFIKTIG